MANSTTNTQETRQFPLPSIKISYSGSGVRFLRILGWVNIGIFCLMGILLLFGAIDLFGFAGLGIFIDKFPYVTPFCWRLFRSGDDRGKRSYV